MAGARNLRGGSDIRDQCSGSASLPFPRRVGGGVGCVQLQLPRWQFQVSYLTDIGVSTPTHVVQWRIKLLDSRVLLDLGILTCFELKVYSTRIQQSQTCGQCHWTTGPYMQTDSSGSSPLFLTTASHPVP
jgi:hypothetical protein